MGHLSAAWDRYELAIAAAREADDASLLAHAAGEVIIPAGQTVYPDFAIPLVNEHQYGTSKSFSIVITSTTPSVTLSPGTGTETILGGNVPLDCAFTWISDTAQSMTCTARPASQVWRIQGECKANMGGFFIPEPGSNVTGHRRRRPDQPRGIHGRRRPPRPLQ